MINYCDLSVSGVNENDWNAVSKYARVTCPCGTEWKQHRQEVLRFNRLGYKHMLCRPCNIPMRTFNCSGCGVEVTRLESLCVAKELYCSQTCHNKRVREKATVTATCKKCDKEFTHLKCMPKEYCSKKCLFNRNPYEPCAECGELCPKSRKYCSSVCAGVGRKRGDWENRKALHPYVNVEQCIRAKETDPIDCICSSCEKPFQVKYSTIRRKWRSNPKKVICTPCQVESQRIKDTSKASRSNYKHITKRVKEDRGRCDECKLRFFPLLDVHHKDGDRKNNSSENLEVLCKNCHACRHLIKRKGKWAFQSGSLTPRDEIPDWKKFIPSLKEFFNQ